MEWILELYINNKQSMAHCDNLDQEMIIVSKELGQNVQLEMPRVRCLNLHLGTYIV